MMTPTVADDGAHLALSLAANVQLSYSERGTERCSFYDHASS
jgi:hypothetical protein